MKNNLKLVQNLRLFTAFVFLLVFIIDLSVNKPTLFTTLNVIITIRYFINSYINHKEINKYNED